MLSPTVPAERAQRRRVTTSQPPLISIGVTIHNRHDMLKKTMAAIRQLAPEGARIVLVDDASDVPVQGATFRFEKNVGIAQAKKNASSCWTTANTSFSLTTIRIRLKRAGGNPTQSLMSRIFCTCLSTLLPDGS